MGVPFRDKYMYRLYIYYVNIYYITYMLYKYISI